jgi:hypothetical protein
MASIFCACRSCSSSRFRSVTSRVIWEKPSSSPVSSFRTGAITTFARNSAPPLRTRRHSPSNRLPAPATASSLAGSPAATSPGMKKTE